jgi:hypothetical protein
MNSHNFCMEMHIRNNFYTLLFIYFITEKENFYTTRYHDLLETSKKFISINIYHTGELLQSTTK